MVNPRRTVAELQQEIAALRAQLAALPRLGYVRENESLRAQLAELQSAQPPSPYIALKAVDGRGYSIDSLKRWGRRRLIDSKRVGSRWFCRQSSVDAWIKRSHNEGSYWWINYSPPVGA
jgi:hypothetical protein